MTIIGVGLIGAIYTPTNMTTGEQSDREEQNIDEDPDETILVTVEYNDGFEEVFFKNSSTDTYVYKSISDSQVIHSKQQDSRIVNTNKLISVDGEETIDEYEYDADEFFGQNTDSRVEETLNEINEFADLERVEVSEESDSEVTYTTPEDVLVTVNTNDNIVRVEKTNVQEIDREEDGQQVEAEIYSIEYNVQEPEGIETEE